MSKLDEINNCLKAFDDIEVLKLICKNQRLIFSTIDNMEIENVSYETEPTIFLEKQITLFETRRNELLRLKMIEERALFEKQKLIEEQQLVEDQMLFEDEKKIFEKEKLIFLAEKQKFENEKKLANIEVKPDLTFQNETSSTEYSSETSEEYFLKETKRSKRFHYNGIRQSERLKAMK